MLNSSFIFSPFETSYKSKVCPRCKMDLNTIIKNGRIGCSECYVAFKENLLPSIKDYHGSLQHVGKFPSNYKGSNKGRIQSINEKLTEAVTKEDYIEAAKLRDLIKEIEGNDI